MIRPKMVETTALGAAMAAALTLKLWNLKANEMTSSATIFHPKMSKSEANEKFGRWKEAIARSVGWAKV